MTLGVNPDNIALNEYMRLWNVYFVQLCEIAQWVLVHILSHLVHISTHFVPFSTHFTIIPLPFYTVRALARR